MKRSITKNYIYNLLYQILVMFIPLITTPYLSRVFGAENLGIYSYTLSIVTYFILFGSIGLGLYGQREVAFYQEDKEKYTKSFWEVFLLKLITMTLSGLVYFFVFVNGTEYKLYYTILLLELIGNCIDISWFFQGLEEFKKTVLRNTFIKVISLFCIFIFIKSENDLVYYFIIYVLSTFLGNLTLWFYLPKYLVKINFKDINVFKHLKPTLAIFIPQIAIQVYTLLDKTMIGSFITNKSAVGYYDNGQKIIKVLLTVITSLGTVMMPRIANTFAKGNRKQIQKYMNNSFNVVFFLAFPMIFGIISVTPAFVPIFFGSGYEPVISLMSIISPIILLIGLSNVTGTQYLLPTKRQKEYTISVVCGALVNFCLNFVLISKYGAFGASTGTVIAETVVTAVQMFYVRKDFELKHVFHLSINYIFSSLIMFVFCLVVRNLINNNLISVIAQVLVGIIVYISFLLVFKDNFLIELITKFKKRLRSKRYEKI